MRNKQRYFIPILLVLLLVLLWMRNQHISFSPRAAAPAVSILMLPKTGTLAANEQKDISLLIQTGDPNNKVSGFDIIVNSQGGLQFIAASPPVNLATNDGANITQLKKQIDPAQIHLAYSILSTNDQLPTTIKITLTVKGSGTATQQITLDQTASQVVGTIAENTYTWGVVDQASFSGSSATVITPTGTTGCQPPSSPTGLTPNGTLDTAGNTQLSWNSVGSGATYTVTVTDIGSGWVGTGGTPAPDVFVITAPSMVYSFKAGHIYKWSVSAVLSTCSRQSAPNEAYVYVSTGVTPSVITTETLTPTATAGTPIPTPTLEPLNVTLRARFQGIVTKPSLQTVTIPAQINFVRFNDWNHRVTINTAFTYAGRGIWEVIDAYQIVPGDHYKVYIKGEKHLQREICDGRPADKTPGSYQCSNEQGNIVITREDNVLDFSDIIQFAGDIPFKGENNGIIDAYDISYISTHLGEDAPIADLNYDGVVDSQDFSLAIGAMQIQRQDQF